MQFSKELICNYRLVMLNDYGVEVSDEQAESDLTSLTRTLFPLRVNNQTYEPH